MKGLLGAILLAPLCIAQTSTVTGAGYTQPAPLSAAPGQVMTFFLQGLGLNFKGPLPDIVPLPVTATLLQGGTSTAAPVLAEREISTCPTGNVQIGSSIACANLTAVTVQIPYELAPICPLCANPIQFPPPWIDFSLEGQPGSAIELNPLMDQVHVLTACDLLLQAGTAPPTLNYTGLPCLPEVTHGDGSLASPYNPAKPGEELTAWVTGLGATDPATPTGKPATTPVPTAETLLVAFDYALNALPMKPTANAPKPVYSGLVPGFTGLYQINFITPPEPPNGIAQCALPGTLAYGGNILQSNLTVSFGGQFSFDGAGICVMTHVPVD